jgi:hypothetical protein
MILRATDGTVYKVHFRHHLPSEVKRPETYCFVHAGDCRLFLDECLATDNYILVGGARCSRHDVFTKRLGRKIALGRALKQLELPKQTWLQLIADYERQLLPKVKK